MTFEKNKNCPLLRFECFEHVKRFLICVKHVNFAIDGNHSKNFYGNPNYCGSLVIFQTYKNVILRSVHSLE
jgi:hypothetical protein